MKKLAIILIVLLPLFALAEEGRHNYNNRIVIDLPHHGFYEVVIGNRVHAGTDRIVFDGLRNGRHHVEIYEKFPYEGYHLVYSGSVRTAHGQRVKAAFRNGRLRILNSTAHHFRADDFYSCRNDDERYRWLNRNYNRVSFDFYIGALGAFHSDMYRWRAHQRFNGRFGHVKHYRQRTERCFKNDNYRKRFRNNAGSNNRGHSNHGNRSGNKRKGYK